MAGVVPGVRSDRNFVCHSLVVLHPGPARTTSASECCGTGAIATIGGNRSPGHQESVARTCAVAKDSFQWFGALPDRGLHVSCLRHVLLRYLVFHIFVASSRFD